VNQTYCGNDHLLDEPSSLPPAQRQPCPTCGALSRIHRVNLGANTVARSRTVGTTEALPTVHSTDRPPMVHESSAQIVGTGSISGTGQRSRRTTRRHVVTLIWDAPADDESDLTSLQVWVDGELTSMAFQADDLFGLLVDTADPDDEDVDPPGILPTWD